MHRLRLVVSLVLLAVSPAFAAPPDRVRLDAIAAEARRSGDLPGLLVAVVDREGAVEVGVAGVRRRGSEAPLERADRVHLGSCTKAVTATVAAILVKEGRLRWESSIGELFGAEAHEAWREATLADLLAHRAGAPAQPDDALWRRAWTCGEPPEACRAAFVRDLLAAPPAGPRGAFVYSNQGYAIAGRMIELAAGASWESLVRTRIAEPLGMTTVGFGPPTGATDGAAPAGHDEKGVVRDVDNPNAIAPAGTMHCSMEDWARFVAVHLGRPSALEKLGLDEASLAALHAAQGKDGTYALGWRTAERPWGGRVVTHAGSNTVWFCVAWVAPERGFAVLVATNQGGPAATKACDEAAAALVQVMAQPTAR